MYNISWIITTLNFRGIKHGKSARKCNAIYEKRISYLFWHFKCHSWTAGRTCRQLKRINNRNITKNCIHNLAPCLQKRTETREFNFTHLMSIWVWVESHSGEALSSGLEPHLFELCHHLFSPQQKREWRNNFSEPSFHFISFISRAKHRWNTLTQDISRLKCYPSCCENGWRWSVVVKGQENMIRHIHRYNLLILANLVSYHDDP